jgi:MHS family citrate/tricarballylate:H+ symporter-like MFS transporter
MSTELDVEPVDLGLPALSLPRFWIAAATIGNALEFYDFLTYVFFSIQIGHAFFPSHSAYGSLMLSLATFGAGFLTRPLGALVLGAYADRAGRKASMMVSLCLMGASVMGMALIPTYATIGIAAPILAVIARMAQGFSFGGEVGSTTAYLLEAAPVERRGRAVAWQGASQAAAGLVASLIGAGMAATLSPATLDSFGWRIALLVGAAALPFGLWLRRALPETLHQPDPAPVLSAPGVDVGGVREHARLIVLALTVIAAGAIAIYVFYYLTTFAEDTLHMSPAAAFQAQVVGNVCSFVSVLWGGYLADKIGRRPVMIWPNLIYLLLILPVFYWIVGTRSPMALIVGSGLIGFFSQMPSGALYVAITESMPKHIRGGVFATVYALSLTVFGGTTQLVVAWLIHVTGNPMSPAWYMAGATLVGQIALMMIPESAPFKLAAARAQISARSSA